MNQSDAYTGREQTQIKHSILQKYLERFAHIISSHWDAITYVDCFSGPWNVCSETMQDSSFAIALQELRKVRDRQKSKGRSLRLRCFFLEKDVSAFARLKDFADSAGDAEIRTLNAALEDSVPEILRFVREDGSGTFPFIFIDPTGWTGFAMHTITPLLRLNPGEVLINFMTSHIRRFLDSPQEETQASFERLFGSARSLESIHGLTRQDREDAAVEEYIRNIRKSGDFNFPSTAVVLHPQIDRTHFHLVYATRNPKGLEVFKAVEKKAMLMMKAVRSRAQQRKREAETGQAELFSEEVLYDPSYFDSLRKRYLDKSQRMVREQLQAHKKMSYDLVWALALSQPLTWESDLKAWISEWQHAGQLRIGGMRPSQRVPHQGNTLVWIDS